MGKLLYMKIILSNNPSGVYFGGDVVEGRLLVGFSGDGKKARGIRVQVEGQSDVHWKESRRVKHGDNWRTEYRHYRSSETYVNLRKYVVGNANSTMQIPAGEYEYPFRFELPSSIPSSFVGEYGRIAYCIKGVVDRPWRFDHETVSFFTVIGVYDLNSDSSAGRPMIKEDQKMFGCLCCESGPVSATVKLDRSGYVPGETIYLNAMADNQSTKLMNKSSVELIQTITFYAQGRSKVTTTEVFGYKRGAIEPGESDTWTDTAMRIPVLPPSNLKGCRNINIDYEIIFRVDPSGMGFDLKVELPIVIGTIPLRSTFSQFERAPVPPPPPQPSLPSPSAPLLPPDSDLPPSYDASKDVPTVPQTPFSLYPDLPPPTYEEARNLPSIRMEDDSEHATGNWDFKPIYPYYT